MRKLNIGWICVLVIPACSGSDPVTSNNPNAGTGGVAIATTTSTNATTSNGQGGATTGPAQGGKSGVQTSNYGGSTTTAVQTGHGGDLSSSSGGIGTGGTNTKGGTSTIVSTSAGASRGGAGNAGAANTSTAHAGRTSSAGGNASKGGSSTTSGGTRSIGGNSSGGIASSVRGGAAGSVGTGTGGSGNAGGSGAVFKASFFLGADITNAESASTAAQDSLLSLMKAHGFNSVRLRTFVDPKASDGYDKTNGYADLAHTISFGKKIKDAGMGLLVDFHYSDNWADPGKQCVPIAWQSYTTITDLSAALGDYTKDAITKLIAGGARPDMVQIGNETTPGMLLHRCDSGGQPTGSNPITGSTSNWTNLGALLKAGVKGVKDVDSGILVSFHIDRGNSFSATKSWIDNVVKQGIAFDAFGESCYQRYQGDPNSATATVSGWTTTFAQLVAAYPNVKFFAAEYGPLQREINDVLFNLPNNQGIGTFNWEPDTQGDWNADPAGGATHALFTRSGNSYTALPDLALYDPMKAAYASRL